MQDRHALIGIFQRRVGAVILGVSLLASVLFFMSACTYATTVELQMLVCCGTSAQQRWQSVATAFNESQTGIRVDLQVAAAWREMEEKFLASYLGGTAPALATWEDETFGSFVVKGVLENLDPFVSRDPVVQKELEYYLEPAIEAYKFDPQTGNIGQGSLYGMSYGGGQVLMYYNQEMFDSFGISYPQDAWSWDDFRKISKAMTKDSGDGSVTQCGVSFTSNWRNNWMPLIWSNGGDFLEEPNRSRSVLNSPENIEAITFLYDLYNRYRVATYGNASAFLSGKAAMRPDGPWFNTVINQAKNKVKWGIAAFPPLNKAQVQQTRATFDGVVMSKNTVHPEEAWAFVRYIMAGDGKAILAKDGDLLPASRRALQYSPFGNPDNPHYRFMQLSSISRIQPIILKWLELEQEMGRLHGELRTDTRSPVAIVQEAHEILDRLAQESQAMKQELLSSN